MQDINKVFATHGIWTRSWKVIRSDMERAIKEDGLVNASVPSVISAEKLPVKPVLTQEHMLCAETMAKTVDALPPHMAKHFKRRVFVTFADSQDRGEFMATMALKERKRNRLMVNTGSNAFDSTFDFPPNNLAMLEGSRIFKETGDMEKARAESIRLALFHEIGHVFDRRLSVFGVA